MTGAIIFFGKDVVPGGYLLCNGQAVSRTTYADLFAVTSTTYGVGDGSTTFNVPDLGGKTAAGYDSGDSYHDTLGETGGAKTIATNHTHTMATHNHAMTGSSSNAATTISNDGGAQTTASPSHTHTADTCTIGNQSDAATNSGGSASVSILNPFIVFYPLIKT